MLFDGKPRSYVIAPVEQASLFGAAVAALSR
jgi:hexokinase